MKKQTAGMLWIVVVLWVSLVTAEEVSDHTVAKAKEEKQLTYYTSLHAQIVSTLVQSFQKKYPFIEVKPLRTGSTSLVARILQERSAGKHLFDVVSAPSVQFYQLLKETLFQKYDSPERSAFPDEFKDREGLWTSMTHSLNVMSFNSRLVKSGDLPKAYKDLLEPKWKSKMVMDDAEVAWYAAMLQVLGREQGLRFMRSLAKQELSFRRGRTLITQLLAAGEFPLAVNNYVNNIETVKKDGAPVDWVAADPVISEAHHVALGRHSARSNAGKLFIDFALSDQGQKIIRSFGRSSSRRGVEGDELKKRGGKVSMVDMKWSEEYGRYDREFKDIFGIR